MGTAGSGKSTLVNAFSNWLSDHELSNITVNLDPGASWLPYGPDVDVRDYVNVENVMKDYNLGPNGALIAATDMIAAHIEQIKEEIVNLEADYAIIDTSGQMEVFAFRNVGPYIVSTLSAERSCVVYLIDSIFVERPSNLVSALLLATSVHYRLLKPQVNVLSKSDLVSKERLQQVINWLNNPEDFIDAVGKETYGLNREVSQRVCRMLAEMEAFPEPIPVSAKREEGLEELYGLIQRVVAGGGEETVELYKL
ncbi:MAG: ATP/GTP-binding protein [Candidatus Nezhaarchaeales archaeon]